jgi:hypothetical protein
MLKNETTCLTFPLTMVTRVVRKTAVPYKIEKTPRGGGSKGLQNGEDKEKGAMQDAHRRWKVRATAMLGGGGRRRWLRKPAVVVGGEGRWHRPESEERLAVGDRCGGG